MAFSPKTTNRPASFRQLAEPTLNAGRVSTMDAFVQHGQTSTLGHTTSVAYHSLSIARALRLHCNEQALVRGALLHDYYLYDWHDHESAPDSWHGFTHPRHALRNAERDFPDLTSLERDIIAHHMFPLVPSPPRHREALLVSIVDKICTVVEVATGQPWHSRSWHVDSPSDAQPSTVHGHTSASPYRPTAVSSKATATPSTQRGA